MATRSSPADHFTPPPRRVRAEPYPASGGLPGPRHPLPRSGAGRAARAPPRAGAPRCDAEPSRRTQRPRAGPRRNPGARESPTRTPPSRPAHPPRPAPTRLCGVRAPGRGAQSAGGFFFPAARPGAGVSSLTRHGGSSREARGGGRAARGDGGVGRDPRGWRGRSATRARPSRGVQSSGGDAAGLLRPADGMREGRGEGDLGPLGSHGGRADPGGGRGLVAAACCKLDAAEAK